MVAITERAGALLERIQIEQSLPHALRIELVEVEPEEGALAVGITDPAPDDEVLYYGETPVLYISAPAAEVLAGCTLATQDTPEGTALTVAPLAELDPEWPQGNGRWPGG
jgi:hypothetical protein